MWYGGSNIAFACCSLLVYVSQTVPVESLDWRSHYAGMAMPPQFRAGQNEDRRLAQWRDYYKDWPVAWPKETPGFREYAVRREEEIMREKPGSARRWEYWLDFAQTRLHPNFTENGYAIRQIPPQLFEKLQKSFHGSYSSHSRAESAVPYFIEGDRKMIDIPPALRTELIEGVQPIHEEWAGGIPLTHTAFYGIRAYENGSTLAMHVDRANTHVISAVMHIARDYGVETGGGWPIEIVDLDGNQQEVELQPGQMLLYESSKCYHGRPKAFNGKYYASAFMHFKPKHGWDFDNDHRVAAIPPHFNSPYQSWKKSVLPRLVDSLPPRTAESEDL